MAKVPHAEAISNLDKPKGMRADTWVKVKRLLRLLSSYGDDIYPSLRTLSRKLGMPLPTVHRLVVTAETAGFITRAPRPVGAVGRPGTSYEFVPSICSKLEQSKRKKKRTTSSSPPQEGGLASAAPTPSRNQWPGKCYACERPVAAGEGILHRNDPVHEHCEAKMNRDWQRQQAEDFNGPSALGEDPQAPLPVLGPTKVHPAARLAYRFERQWYDEILPQHPDWRQHGCIILGPAIGYIKKSFLSNGYSPDHVEAYFQAFFNELTYPSNPLMMRPGQTVWQLFTGWWPHSLVPDPAIEKEKQRVRDAVRADMAAGLARSRAAMARVLAAHERGEDHDPEDWKIAQGIA